MRRQIALVSFGFCLATALAVADAPPAPNDRLSQLHRNRKLVEVLVAGAIRLAADADALHRASCCQEMVNQFAQELRLASETRDERRAEELGLHFEALLRQGIAPNLSLARGEGGPHQQEAVRRMEAELRETSRSLEVLLDQMIATAGDGRPQLARVKIEVEDARRTVSKAAGLP